MREVRDSFLKFLADNLPSDLPVHAIRRDPNDPISNILKSNAVNVQFLNLTLEKSVSTQLTSVDVLADDETTALESVNQVWQLLSASYYTPQLNYLDPAHPVPTFSNIYWPVKGLQFKPIYSDYYFHYSLSLQIKFHPISYKF